MNQIPIRRFILACVGAGVLIASLILWPSGRKNLRADGVKRTFVSPSGQRLETFFDGLPQNSRYSLKRILDANRQVVNCGERNSSPKLLSGIFGQATVHAFSCPDDNGNCKGGNWEQYTNECDTGGGCSGTYEDTRNNPEYPCWGFTYDGINCGTLAQCGCENLQCYSCE
jgi:hypothetical protein